MAKNKTLGIAGVSKTQTQRIIVTQFSVHHQTVDLAGTLKLQLQVGAYNFKKDEKGMKVESGLCIFNINSKTLSLNKVAKCLPCSAKPFSSEKCSI